MARSERVIQKLLKENGATGVEGGSVASSAERNRGTAQRE